MNRINEACERVYLKTFRKVNKKQTIIQEVLQNLEEKVWDLMEQGKAEEDAINKAIVEFGDAEDLKKELGVTKTAR